VCPENAMYESYITKYLEQIANNTDRIADALEIQIKNIAKHERLHAETKIRNTIDELKKSLIDEGLSND
jgi:hypothetical protein